MTSGSPVIVEAVGKHTATMIFLHGINDTGKGWATTIQRIRPPYVKVICPNAPSNWLQYFGFGMPSWFDVVSLSTSGTSEANGIKTAAAIIHKMIKEEETKTKIPSNRIMLGGFSQGGALSLHSALSYTKPLAGELALSTWLPLHKEYPTSATLVNRNIPLLQCHGDVDPIVPYNWGVTSSKLMKTFLTQYEFKTYAGLAHTARSDELGDARTFIRKCLPPIASSTP